MKMFADGIPYPFLTAPLLFGCSKKDVVASTIYDSVGRINQWILDSMKRYYYWGDDISAKPVSADPDVFFKGILSVNDRFSWISDGAALRGAAIEPGARCPYF